MASMKDVAELAGVSISTVSRVISSKIPVDDETKQRVNQAIEELKYKPNLIASGLRNKSGRSIGLLVPKIADSFFAKLIDFVDRAVIDKGYNLLLYNTHMDPDFEEQVIDNLLRRNVDGIIFSRVSSESWAMELLNDIDVPVVMLDRVGDSDKIMRIVLDNRKAGKMAVDHLSGLGHTWMACLTGPRKINLCRDRLAGFQEALNKKGIDLDESMIIEGDFTFECGLSSAERLMNMDRSPTAVWAQSDIMAVGLLKKFLQKGVRIPQDMSIMGMDGADLSVMLQPSLTTIVQPIKEMAEKAVDLILEHKKHVTETKRRIILEPRFVIGESTGRFQEA